MDRDIDLDSEASAGGDMYGDLKGDDNGDGDDMYGDLGGDDDDDAVDEDDEEENKAVSDSVTHTAAPSTSTETAPSVTTGEQERATLRIIPRRHSICMCHISYRCHSHDFISTLTPPQTSRWVLPTVRKVVPFKRRGITAHLLLVQSRTSRTHYR